MSKVYQSNFATQYDEFVGDRSTVAKNLKKIIIKHAPNTKTILELACGTGALMYPLSKKYQLTGVDLSDDMLRQARKKVPEARLIRGDVKTVNLQQRFDFAFMLFDSINHLVTLKSWEQVFKNCSRHLKPNGLFLFDFNTKTKLDFLNSQPPTAKILEKSKALSIHNVSRKRKLYLWNIKLYKLQNSDYIYSDQENIPEATFKEKQVISSFRRYFSVLKIFDEKNKKPTEASKRIYLLGKLKTH